ncbi:MAG: cell wall hydrolase [Erythrobacter sp.]|nr:MAG: cell wall hydrolase [Erythrobacter sp.]
MPFEQPGMSFPGSAFYYLADPPERAALIALPAPDPLAEAPAEGAPLDPGPAAAPFLAASASPRAADCLAEAIFYEAASESEAGQRAVAQVVLNRVRHAAWPNSVCGVVFEGSERSTGCQFTFTCDGSRARPPRGAAWARARRIAGAALAGEVYAPVGLATHYHTLWVAPRWAASLDSVGTIGAHVFYRSRGNAGQLAAFDEAYAGADNELGPGAGARGPAPQARPRAPAPSDSAKPAAARQSPVPSPAPSAEPAKGSGSVRAEYRTAGSWKARPEPPAPAPHIAVEPLAAAPPQAPAAKGLMPAKP